LHTRVNSQPLTLLPVTVPHYLPLPSLVRSPPPGQAAHSLKHHLDPLIKPTAWSSPPLRPWLSLDREVPSPVQSTNPHIIPWGSTKTHMATLTPHLGDPSPCKQTPTPQRALSLSPTRSKQRPLAAPYLPKAPKNHIPKVFRAPELLSAAPSSPRPGELRGSYRSASPLLELPFPTY
jgi:hypothetical protein